MDTSDTPNTPFEVRWKLPELLEREGITVYKLMLELNKKVSRSTLYRWTQGVPERPDLEAIGWILWALKELTGKRFNVTDLLDYPAVKRRTSKTRGDRTA